MPLESLEDINQSHSTECSHCKDQTLHPINDGEQAFCCYGCQTVFHALKDKDLLHYYKLRDQSGEKLEAPESMASQKDFSYLNEENFQKEFLRATPNGIETKFYLEGIHCLACVWLLEKTPTFIEGITNSRVQLGLSTVDLTISPDANLEKIAFEISKMGYRPHPIKSDSEAQSLQKKEDRLKLIQIGVAAACSANIMLYSIAIYAGAGSNFSSLFGWVSFFLSIPVIFFSALPFYKSSINALKNFSVNIDIPISIALILGTVSGLYNLSVGSDHYYFDSLAILVFLLLSSRFLVHRSLQNGLNSKGLNTLFKQSSILRLNKASNQYESIHSDYINKGDVLKILKGQTIPNDSIVLEGSSFINNSLISGESKPVEVNCETFLYAGAQNISTELVIKVQKDFKDSSLGKIISKVEQTNSEKLSIQSLTDKLSKWFVLAVFVISTSAFIYFFNTFSLNIAIERTLALIIISCPCALGLASPLALARAMSIAKSDGIIIKSEKTLEELAKSKSIFFDKTGTLTKGKFEVTKALEISKIEDIKKIVNSLESSSNHPIAISLVNWAQTNEKHVVESLLETPGVGVSGIINNVEYKIVKEVNNESSLSKVNLYKNGTLSYQFELKDQLRSNAKDLINFLKSKGTSSSIISGDSSSTVNSVSKDLGIRLSQAYGDMTPERKANLIKKSQNTVMIGDGANDAIAMKEANVSISLRGAMDISLRASDIYLTKDPMKGIKEIINLSTKTYFSIKANLIISLLYNIVGVTLSLFGIVTPLFAAVLMPLSSLSVVAATLINLRGKKA
jgi:Cu2+-exporting ATPase/Cu+-exporting ATPase